MVAIWKYLPKRNCISSAPAIVVFFLLLVLQREINQPAQTKINPRHSPVVEEDHQVQQEAKENEAEDVLVDEDDTDVSGNDLSEEQGTRIQKVILVTQYRGGSTFLGEVFNQHPNAFYWYEPLAKPSFDYKHSIGASSPFQFDNGTLRNLPSHFSNKLQTILHSIVNCRISDVDLRVLQHYFVTNWEKSAKIIPYKNCLKQDTSLVSINSCLPLLRTACLKSSIRVVKTIRYLVGMAEELLKIDPSVKFINYVRDPRGTLLSIMDLEATRDVGYDRKLAASRKLCQRLADDHAHFKRLQNVYPENFYLLRYEDLAANPVKTVKELFNFIHIDYAESVMSWIQRSTQEAGERHGGLGTGQRNSSAVALRWQNSLSAEEQMLITSQCEDVIDIYKYP